MTINPIGDMATAALDEVDDPPRPRRAQMLSRRANPLNPTVIEAESHVDASTGQMKGRRIYGYADKEIPTGGIKDGGLRTTGQE